MPESTQMLSARVYTLRRMQMLRM